MSTGRVLFVGCGPGAADLLTLRAVRALELADVIIWSPSLIAREAVAAHARPDSEIVEWPPATQRDIEAVYDRARAADLVVVRLKGGDPMLFGAMAADLAAVRDRGLACEIVPGVSAVGASAAALGREIATTDVPLLLVASSALCDRSDPCAVAAYGASRDPHALQEALLRRGLPRGTACAVAVEVSRPGETLLSCTLDELGETIEDMALGLLSLVVAIPSGTSAQSLGGSSRARTRD